MVVDYWCWNGVWVGICDDVVLYVGEYDVVVVCVYDEFIGNVVGVDVVWRDVEVEIGVDVVGVDCIDVVL